MKRDIKVLFRNHQWMVQRYGGIVYLVEILEDHPDDLDGGFWIEALTLASATGINHYNEVPHICDKSWVDIDAFEEAAKVAFHYTRQPNYNFESAVNSARRTRERIANRQPLDPDALYAFEPGASRRRLEMLNDN